VLLSTQSQIDLICQITSQSSPASSPGSCCALLVGSNLVLLPKEAYNLYYSYGSHSKISKDDC